MSGVGQSFKLYVSISAVSDGTPLYFKVDGARFKEQRTIKACCGVQYKIKIIVRPVVGLVKDVVVGGDDLGIKQTHHERQSSTFESLWKNTAYEPTKSGKRTNVPLLIYIDGVGKMEVPLQFKFYDASDKTHSQWGDQLRQLEFECQAPDGGSGLIDVVRMTYR